MRVFDFFAFLAIIILGILLLDTRGRLKRAEKTLAEAAKRIGALQRHAGVEIADRPPPPAPRLSQTSQRTGISFNPRQPVGALRGSVRQDAADTAGGITLAIDPKLFFRPAKQAPACLA
ncbi:hypothetical protein [Sphingopyxis sp. JAI128]|uniref:hypothetical protein n=1 Tax=Sphingopyxis sp. JAI128 TaxID=2723066 RepID=UPI00160FE5A5|nr:hypothetical protein [Sphingopyxis sp. JAI128]MBB6425758.1 hypothetical protein [Sphingopyxis sp. JAI128]